MNIRTISTYGKGDAQLFFNTCPLSFTMNITDETTSTKRVATCMAKITKATFAESYGKKKWNGILFRV